MWHVMRIADRIGVSENRVSNMMVFPHVILGFLPFTLITIWNTVIQALYHMKKCASFSVF